jgi:hypothetical protein
MTPTPTGCPEAEKETGEFFNQIHLNWIPDAEKCPELILLQYFCKKTGCTLCLSLSGAGFSEIIEGTGVYT